MTPDEPLGHQFVEGAYGEAVCCYMVARRIWCGQPRDRHKARPPEPPACIGPGPWTAARLRERWEQTVSNPKPPDSDEEAARAWLLNHCHVRIGGVVTAINLHDHERVASLAALLRERAAAADRRQLEPIATNPCSVCGQPILKYHGGMVGTGDGQMWNGGSFAHPECYQRQRAEAAEAKLAALEAERTRAENVWGELVCIVGCTSPDGFAELDQVRYYKERIQALEAERDQYKNAYGNAVDHRAAIAAESEAQRKRIEELLAVLAEAQPFVANFPAPRGSVMEARRDGALAGLRAALSDKGEAER